MYNIDIIKSAINIFKELSKKNIKGYKKINFIKNTLGCHINSIYNWINKFKNLHLNTFNKSKYNNVKVTDEIEIFILNSITKFNTFNIKKIKSNIKKKFNIILSRTTIYNVLHKNNLTYKKTKVKTIPYTNEKLKELKNELINKIKPVQNYLNSYDEMAIYLNDTPTYGWSIKGKDCIIENKKTLIKKRFTIGMAIDKKANIDFTLIEGSLKQDKLNKNKLKSQTFFMDNASIHKSKKMKMYIEKNNINVIFNIPYCSEFNPIEYIFSLLRKKLINENVESINDILKIVINFKKEINKEHVKNIFNKCIKSIEN